MPIPFNPQIFVVSSHGRIRVIPINQANSGRLSPTPVDPITPGRPHRWCLPPKAGSPFQFSCLPYLSPNTSITSEDVTPTPPLLFCRLQLKYHFQDVLFCVGCIDGVLSIALVDETACNSSKMYKVSLLLCVVVIFYSKKLFYLGLGEDGHFFFTRSVDAPLFSQQSHPPHVTSTSQLK